MVSSVLDWEIQKGKARREPGHSQKIKLFKPDKSIVARPEPARNTRIEISNWRPFEKNTLRGFLTITLPPGMSLHGCTLHDKNGSRWIGLPAQKFTKDDGTISYTPIIEFTTKDARDRFNAAALQAIDAAGVCR